MHSRNLRRFKSEIVCGYASRDKAKAAAFCGKYRGTGSYSDYADAINDPNIDAVVVAVPPRFHLNLTLQALAAGKHVLVEKPAYVSWATTRWFEWPAIGPTSCWSARTITTSRSHCARATVERRRHRRDGVRLLQQHRKRLKTEDDWRNDESMAGGDAFFEEGITGFTWPPASAEDHRHSRFPASTVDDRSRQRVKSMMVSFAYDNGAVGSLYYSRNPSMLKGLRLSKLYGRKGIITFESNGVIVLARGQGLPKLIFPGFRDIRGYQAMYATSCAIVNGAVPR